MEESAQIGPDWDRLFEIASSQSGYFTTQQAATAGYSTHLLRKHIHAGRVIRAQRGIYRLIHFPAGDHEEFVTAWLWSDQVGVVSHESALALHGLSDVLPAHIHLTLPSTGGRAVFACRRVLSSTTPISKPLTVLGLAQCPSPARVGH